MSYEYDGNDRLPPHNRDAERSVLGSMLRDNNVIPEVVQLVRADDFYVFAHQKIFEALATLNIEQGKPADVVTLANWLNDNKLIEDAGGYAYLVELWDAAPSAANARHYADIIRQKAIVRNLIHACNDLQQDAYNQVLPAQELLDSAERRIFEIAEMGITGDTKTLQDAIREAYVRLDQRKQRGDMEYSGIPTGFTDLDRLTAGLQNSELVIVAARPSVGKTSFALNLLRHVVVEERLPALFVSLEQARVELAERLLCCQARVDSHKLRKGHLNADEIEKLFEAGDILSQAKLFIDDTPGQGMLRIAANARRLKLRHDLRIVVIDYLQLIDPDDRRESRQEQVAAISRRLKFLARELTVPVVALAQVNRSSEDRQDHRPRLSDLRECVTGDTLVMLTDGRRVPIRTLVGTCPDVLAMTPEGRIEAARSDVVWSVGRRPVFDLRLASGRTIRATARHRLYAAAGWTRLDALGAGDRVAVARQVPEPSQAGEWPDERLVLLAHLIGDGSYLVHQPLRYTTSSEENSDAVEQAAVREFGVRVNRHPGRGAWHQLVFSGNGNRWHPAGVNRWLRELGVFGQRSFEKRVPDAVFALGNRQVALLLRHLWATDGSICPRRNGQRGADRVYFATSSSGLARDVAALLLRFGIVARLRTSPHAKYRPTYTVDVTGGPFQRRFLECVGGFGPRLKPAEELAARLADRASCPNVDTLPAEVFDDVKRRMAEQGVSWRRMAAMRGTAFGGSAHFKFAPSRDVAMEYATLLNDPILRQRAESDLFWDRVVSITPAGEEEVFDLTVPGPASWLADGIISHNSGAIEQDADTVMILHRPDYHEPGQQEGVIEIIVAKQRNGPTGEVTLAYVKQFMRFENFAVEPTFGGG